MGGDIGCFGEFVGSILRDWGDGTLLGFVTTQSATLASSR
jgi:hypothetical protein